MIIDHINPVLFNKLCDVLGIKIKFIIAIKENKNKISIYMK